MAEYQYGQAVEVEIGATDNTDWPLFGEEGKGYEFNHLPPFTFVDEAGDGDLIVRDAAGELMDVSPQFVALEAPLESDDEPEEDPVRQPGHYKGKGGMEAIDVIEAFGLNYRLGNAQKYMLRAGKKGTEADAITDLRKAMAYINREINAREGGATW